MSGNFGHFILVRSFCHVMSGNFVVTFFRFKNPGYVVGLPLITIRCFLTLKNKINCQGNVIEMSGNFEPTPTWQP